MPFGNSEHDPDAVRRSESIFERWIKTAIEGIPDPDTRGGFIQCSRADRRYTPGVIIEDIAAELVESDIVIADLTGRNANVFYELGVRHATNVNTILIAQSDDDVPFDLRHLRTFFYQYVPDSMLQLQDHLRAAISEILHDRERIDNPVRRYLFERESRKLRQTSGPPGYDVIRDVLAELARMRRDFANELTRVRLLIKTVTGAQNHDGVGSAAILRSLEGVWRKHDGSGLYCSRVVDDQLLFAYSYESGDELDSHFHNMRLVGDALFARFEWFKVEISGYLVLRIVDPNELAGSWWYNHDIPAHTEPDEIFLNEDLPKSNPIVLLRDKSAIEFPAWATEYFDREDRRRFPALT